MIDSDMLLANMRTGLNTKFDTEGMDQSQYWEEVAYHRLELLRRLEWTPLWFSQLKKIVFTCLICNQAKETGHADNCALAKELADD